MDRVEAFECVKEHLVAVIGERMNEIKDGEAVKTLEIVVNQASIDEAASKAVVAMMEIVFPGR